jgi:hypothetical protein
VLASDDETWAAQLTARLVELEKPGEVIEAAGLWMADQFSSDGFVWNKSRKTLERNDSGRRERLRFEGSRWNKAGILIEVSAAALDVSDQRLRHWRRANPGLTVERSDRVDDIVCWSSFYDMSRTPHAILTRADTRVARLGAFCDHLRETAMPWFRGTREPAQLARAVPDALLAPFAFAQDLLEFLVSRDEREQARLLIERVLALDPGRQAAFAEGQELARCGERPRWHTPPTLGWSSFVLELV